MQRENNEKVTLWGNNAPKRFDTTVSFPEVSSAHRTQMRGSPFESQEVGASMFSVLRNVPVSTVFIDVSLCFLAIILASASMPDLGHSSNAVLMLRAAVFAGITVFMFACLGLYRPARLALPAAFWRTLAASALAGSIAYPIFEAATSADYAGHLLPRAVEYLALCLLAGKLCSARLRKALRVPRVLIVGAGPDALMVAQDFRESKTMQRNVVGYYATSQETATVVGTAEAPVFPGSSTIL